MAFGCILWGAMTAGIGLSQTLGQVIFCARMACELMDTTVSLVHVAGHQHKSAHPALHYILLGIVGQHSMAGRSVC